LATVIQPPLADLDRRYRGRRAECLLLAIGLQESGFRHRVQQGGGPAHGYFQFEPIAVKDFVQRGTPDLQAAVITLGWPLEWRALYTGLVTSEGDHMATLLARDNLYRYPDPLPDVGHEAESWRQYLAVWRPGKPSRARWARVYPHAVEAVRA
jgi:hypothetical protein